jgi:hypothetical protein
VCSSLINYESNSAIIAGLEQQAPNCFWGFAAQAHPLVAFMHFFAAFFRRQRNVMLELLGC